MTALERAAWAKRYGRAPANVRPRGNKFHARGLELDGIHFDSTKEARRYRELALLAAAGEISRLEMHPTFSIVVVALYRMPAGAALAPMPAGAPPDVVLCGEYTADFRYVTRAGEVVVEDVKSGPTKTEAYRLRKRLVEAIHGITITEI